MSISFIGLAIFNGCGGGGGGGGGEGPSIAPGSFNGQGISVQPLEDPQPQVVTTQANEQTAPPAEVTLNANRVGVWIQPPSAQLVAPQQDFYVYTDVPGQLTYAIGTNPPQTVEITQAFPELEDSFETGFKITGNFAPGEKVIIDLTFRDATGQIHGTAKAIYKVRITENVASSPIAPVVISEFKSLSGNDGIGAPLFVQGGFKSKQILNQIRASRNKL